MGAAGACASVTPAQLSLVRAFVLVVALSLTTVLRVAVCVLQVLVAPPQLVAIRAFIGPEGWGTYGPTRRPLTVP